MKVSADSNFKTAKPGNVRAVCTRIIDLGTQDGNFGAKHKVMIGWEIEELMDDGRPFLVTSRFTASLHPKSVLGPLLETWRGVAFTDEERRSYDLKRLLGQPCMLTLVEEGDYVNVKAATKMHPTTPKLNAVGQLVHLDLSEFDANVFAGLSDKLREMIEKSPEYQKAVGSAPKVEDGLDAGTTAADEIPF